ncbi:MAG: hypothetical protein HY395_03090 [Candidatus Doudnabacteria bacterium]|nr:hypothetical protein [Candidatus Doudnabacteria bacterium]
MITKARRNAYIVIIAVCIAGSIAIFMFLKPEITDLPDLGSPVGTSASRESSGPPKVFPQDANFDLSVFNSSKFIGLKEITQLTVESAELGKEDPFK